jgi:diketogulonate reductase-like aldo/keto reductase
LDTSPIYGNGFSEKILGEYILKSKDKFFIASKYYPGDDTNEDDVIVSVENSLKRLQVDSIDLIQLHWPNPRANLEEVVCGLEKLSKQGKIGSLGTCNFSVHEVNELASIWSQGLLTNQQEVNLNNIGSTEEFLDPSGARTLSYGTLLQGRLSFSNIQRRFLTEAALQIGISPAALTLAIMHVLEPQIIPILKISSVHHLRELIQGLATQLDLSILHEFQKIQPPEIRYIEPNLISLTGDRNRKPYLTTEEALRNPLELFPSPASLSERMIKYSLIMPLKVIALRDGSFQVDAEDPFDQIKKYWAWCLAYPGSKIPVIIFESEGEESHEL